jgi:hypothetical protein
MSRHRSYRSATLALVVFLTLFSTAATPTARATAAPPAAKEPAIKLDQPASTKGLRVAVLPVVNGSGDADADKIMEDVLREQLQLVDRSRAIFLLPGDVERVLTDSNALDRALRVTERWAKVGSLDSTAVRGLDSLLVADAVLCVKVTEWETKRVHNIGEGQSSTTIGIHFALFSIRDKKQLWTKQVREQRLSRELDLSSGTIGYDDTGRIQTANATEPPRVQDVASDLVRDALKKFPNK